MKSTPQSPRTDIPYGSTIELDGRKGKFLLSKDTGESRFLPEEGESQPLSPEQIARMTLIAEATRQQASNVLKQPAAPAPAVRVPTGVSEAAPKRPVPPGAMPAVYLAPDGTRQLGFFLAKNKGTADKPAYVRLFFPSPDRETPGTVPAPITLTDAEYGNKVFFLLYDEAELGKPAPPPPEPQEPIELTPGEQAALDFIRSSPQHPDTLRMKHLNSAAAITLMKGGLLTAAEKAELYAMQNQSEARIAKSAETTSIGIEGMQYFASLKNTTPKPQARPGGLRGLWRQLTGGGSSTSA
ncbi:MAG TPA: hypothetical protein PKV72_05785 [Candidatus Peribacteria bacterium]|nr:hypothetical protein [Candidatus Peribacteria bacterium]